MNENLLTQEQQELADKNFFIFKDLISNENHYFDDAYYVNCNDLTTQQQVAICDAINGIRPGELDAAFEAAQKQQQPSQLFGPSVADGLCGELAGEADLVAKAETIAAITPQIYADWQNVVREAEIAKVAQMIASTGLDLEDPQLREFIKAASIATGHNEVYERLYNEQVPYIEAIDKNYNEDVCIRKIAEEFASIEPEADKDTSLVNE